MRISAGRNMANFIHGHRSKHEPNKRLFTIWHGMIDRCTNPKNNSYNRYGLAGIKVHADWVNYKEFETWALANGYTTDMTLERDDNKLGYADSNCSWITKGAQRANQNRSVKNKLTIAEIADVKAHKESYSVLSNKYNISKTTIARIVKGEYDDDGKYVG